MLVDAQGNDTYEGSDYTQGVGQFGLGALFDLAGQDHYRSGHSAQGAAYFGIGLLADAAGDDNYYLLADGQGLAFGIRFGRSSPPERSGPWNPAHGS